MKKKNTNKIILNLGCGKTRIPGSIGVDIAKIEEYVDVVADFKKLPYPFPNKYADEIHLYHVLEHLPQPLEKLEELHRILKPNGMLHIRVPHFSSMGAFTDITHVRPFGYLSFDPLQINHPQHYYTSVAFRILSKEIKYLGLYPNDGVYERYIHPNECPLFIRPFVRLINSLIRLSPTAFERFWCYWVGGATELHVVLQKQI